MRPLLSPPVPPGRQLPLRSRLTLWMVLIFLMVQLSIALGLQLYLARMIDQFFSRRLTARVGAIAEALKPRLPRVTGEDLGLLANAQTRGQLSEDVAIDVFDADGLSVATSRNPPLVIDPAVLRRGGSGAGGVAMSLPRSALRSADGAEGPVRAAIQGIPASDGRAYFVVLTSSDTNASEMQSLTTRIILASIPIGLIPIALSSYLIAGIAVRPLADIRVLAQRLSPESIDQFIDSASTAQEVGAVRKELELARQRIEAGFATQERFMSNVSHELKTPIAVALTEIQTLKWENTPRQVQEFIRSLTDELEKLGRTVDNFLLLTQVRHGKGHIPALQTCFVREVLLDSYAGCTQMAALHRVRLSLRVPEGADDDAAVMGNCDLLRIIFDNLIRNAIRFSPEGGVVEIAGVAADKHVEVVVRDTGPGIPAELLPRVFDRFSQAKGEERRGRGHGLGLEIALGIAELHGGSIVARNRAQAGCEFVVTLPRSDVAGPAAESGSLTA